MKMSPILLAACLAFTLAARPLQAQAPIPTAPFPTAPTSPEQAELLKITAENSIADQKTKKKMRQLVDDKEELRIQYELLLQKQKLKITDLEDELSRLSLANRISAETNRKGIDSLVADMEKTSVENRLAEEKNKAALSKLEAEYAKLAAQNRLTEEQSKAEMSKPSEQLRRLELENRVSAETNKKAVEELARQVERLRLGNDLRAEQQREQQITDDREKRSIELGIKRLDLEERKLHIEKLTMDSRMAKLASDLELRDKKAEWKKETNKEPSYPDKPFSDGRLVISDRRVSLNGPIFTGVADYVTERIHYFNNISSQPVFLVIDRCPGGSVMEGYRIIKAMQGSKAPVYVVVKSFAASMAAVITTMADKSYIYPNAILLHHQMSTMNWGNMTQLKEQLELAREWERRLHLPVAQKMGISLDDFRKKMYEKNSDGDWEEFGDRAVSYNWASSVVQEIDETGFVKNPDLQPKPAKPSFWLDELTDEKGQRYVALPRLQPFDFYFIYNPDRYFR